MVIKGYLSLMSVRPGEELQGSSAVVAGKPIPTHGLDSWRIKMNPAFGRRVPPSDGSRIRGAPAEIFS